MTHLRIATSRGNGDYKSLCNARISMSTNSPPFVTCKECIKKMEELGIEIKAVDYCYEWSVSTQKIKWK